MIRSAVLLLGAGALRPIWLILLVAGMAWVALGAWILGNLHDPEVVYIEDTLAIFIVLEGCVRLLHAAALGVRRYWGELVRGPCFLAAGIVILKLQWDHNIGAAVVFGSAFLADALMRLGTAYVLRGERLGRNLRQGVASLVIAAVILTEWPLPRELTVPFYIALLLLMSGYKLSAAALQLYRLAPGDSITQLPIYGSSNWQYRGIAVLRLEPPSSPSRGELTVFVWTATGPWPTTASAAGRLVESHSFNNESPSFVDCHGLGVRFWPEADIASVRGGCCRGQIAIRSGVSQRPDPLPRERTS